MNITVADTQTIGETEANVTAMIQTGTVEALFTLSNIGVNTMTYKFQEKIGSTWTDMGSLGSDLYNTLSAGQVKAIKVSSAYPQVRLRGFATGGTELEFGVLRYFERGSGGDIPILTL